MSKNKSAHNILTLFFIKFKTDKKYRLFIIGYVLLSLFSIAFLIVVFNNQQFYNKPIAKIISIEESGSQDNTDVFGYTEPSYTQYIKAVVINGEHKGEKIEFKNKSSYSQAFDFKYKINDEVFLDIKDVQSGEITSFMISDLKRDKYIAVVLMIFIMLIILIGKRKGILSLLSVIFNILLVVLIIDLFSRGYNIIIISVFSSIFFVVCSLFIIEGINRKSFSAIICTLTCSMLSVIIAFFVMHILKSKGVFYEEMEFITSNPEKIFIAGVLIGTLGAIMDIAVSISSTITEILNTNPDIDHKALIKSGKEIGNDIMGTMANCVLFAYISGSLPIIILLLKNGYSPFYVIKNNISLEMIRAVTCCIGMVLCIPVSIFVSVLLIKKRTKIEVKQ